MSPQGELDATLAGRAATRPVSGGQEGLRVSRHGPGRRATSGRSRWVPNVARCVVLALVAVVVVAACSHPAAPPIASGTPTSDAGPGSRGALISAEVDGTWSSAEVSANVPGLYQVGGNQLLTHDVTTYRVTYSTIDPHGAPITASGLVALPDSAGRHPRVVTYEHGTMTGRNEAPSTNPGMFEAVILGSAGMVTSVPDYLGLGSGPGPHYYLDAASEVSASIDMLRATWQLAGQHGLEPDPRVFVTGMSQGGGAAMEVAHALDTGADPQFRLAAAAPISGPYDMAGVDVPGILDGTIAPPGAVLYAAYWVVSMNRLFRLYDDPSSVFSPPYDTQIEQIFDGTNNSWQAMDSLPGSIAELFTPTFLAWMAHPDGALSSAIEASGQGCAWHPTAPIRLYAGTADRDVPFENAVNCRAEFERQGVDVPLIDLGAVNHNGSFASGFPQVVAWFAELSTS